MTDLPPGWGAVSGDAARDLEAQLARELGPGHVLAGRAVSVIAQRFDDDRILVRLDDGRIASVTLAWDDSSAPSSDLPLTTFDPGAAAPATDFTDMLDLHAFSPRDAKALVRDFLDHWAPRGPCEVRIIHGKGIGAMRELVHAELARHPAVERFALASDRSGWGATVVALR